MGRISFNLSILYFKFIILSQPYRTTCQELIEKLTLLKKGLICKLLQTLSAPTKKIIG